MSSQVREVAGFLESERADVREMACEVIAGYTCSDEGMLALAELPDISAQLLRCLELGGGAAVHAAAALVNLSQQPADRMRLVKARAVEAAVQATLTGAPQLAQYASMLLSNLSQLPDGRAQLLAADGEAAVSRLLCLLCEPEPDAEFSRSHAAAALTNAAQDPGGRAAVLKTLGAGAPSLASCCAQIRGSADETRRLGLATLLRNLCFEAAEGSASREALVARGSAFGAQLASCVAAPAAEYTPSERAEFAPELADAMASFAGAPTAPPAPSPETTLAVAEALVLLTASPDVAAAMRALGVEALLRRARRPETSAAICRQYDELEIRLRAPRPPAAAIVGRSDGPSDAGADEEEVDAPAEEVDD